MRSVIWSLLTIILLLTNCSPQICNEIDCGLDGIKQWIDGDCSCDCFAGFQGDLCEESIFTQLLGSYSGLNSCIITDSISLINDTSAEFSLQIQFSDTTCARSIPIILATVEYDQLQIDTQTLCPTGILMQDYTIFGNGSVNYQDTLELSYSILYKILDSTYIENCTAVFVKN